MLSVVIYAMMGRAIMPLIVDVEDNRIYLFLTAITEPFIQYRAEHPYRYVIYVYLYNFDYAGCVSAGYIIRRHTA